MQTGISLLLNNKNNYSELFHSGNPKSIQPYLGANINRSIGKRFWISFASNYFEYKTKFEFKPIYVPTQEYENIYTQNKVLMNNLTLNYNYINKPKHKLYATAGITVNYYFTNYTRINNATGKVIANYRSNEFAQIPTYVIIGNGYSYQLSKRIDWNTEVNFQLDYGSYINGFAPAINNNRSNILLQTGLKYRF